MNIANLFRKKLQEPPKTLRQIKVVRSTEMTLDEWRNDESLVRQSAELQASNLFQGMTAVLRNESPSSYGVPIGANHDDRIAHACRAEGYNLCMNNLEALARLGKKQEYIESTFEPEFKPKE